MKALEEVGGTCEAEPHFIGPRSLINRTEYIRLLEQTLAHLGYPDLATKLEQQSVRTEYE